MRYALKCYLYSMLKAHMLHIINSYISASEFQCLLDYKEMAKVLISDNESVFRNDLRKLLELDGIFIQEASKPIEALKKVVKEKFDALIFNFTSEDVNSIQVFSAIRELDKKLPVIIVVNKDESLSSASTIIHEAFRYFKKPTDCEEIKEAINDIIKMKSKKYGK